VKTIQKVLISSLAVLLALAAFLTFYRFPKSIDLQYPAVEFRNGDASSAEQTTIAIKGTLYRPLFRNAEFSGTIAVEKYDFTKRYELIDVRFYKEIRNGWGPLVYSYVDDGKPILKSFGSIWKSGDFERIGIEVNEPLPSAATLTIAAPARTYEEARSVVAQMETGGK
jgi:hypothetical protein